MCPAAMCTSWMMAVSLLGTLRMWSHTGSISPVAAPHMLGFIEIGVVAVFPSTLRDLFAFSVLLIILWLRPTGIFGVADTTKI